MRGIFLILLLITLTFSENLVEKYELYRVFLDTKDVILGKKLLQKYPKAPFRDELILMLVKLTYKRNPEEAKRLLKLINLENIPPSYRSEVIKVWRKLGLGLKPLLLILRTVQKRQDV